MKAVLLRALDEKGVQGLKRLKPIKKGLKTTIYCEEPYTKQLTFTNKIMQKRISEKDIQTFLYAFPSIMGCSLKLNINYSMEVIENE